MKRKITFLAVCLLLAAALLTGCGNGGRDEFYAYLDGKVDNSEVQWEEEGFKTYSWDASEEKQLTTKRGIGIGSTLEEVMKAYPEIKTGSFKVDGGPFMEKFSLEEYVQGNVEEQFSEYSLYFAKYFIQDREVSEEELTAYGKTLPEKEQENFWMSLGLYDCKWWGMMIYFDENDKVEQISIRFVEANKENKEQ